MGRFRVRCLGQFLGRWAVVWLLSWLTDDRDLWTFLEAVASDINR